MYIQFHSLIFAQVIGLYLLIMSIVLLMRRDFYRRYVATLKPNGTVNASIIALFLGLLIIDIHNTWLLGQQLIITLLGWFIVIKSILWLTMPEKMLELSQKIYQGKGYYIVVAVAAVVGIYLIAKGFYPFHNFEFVLLG